MLLGTPGQQLFVDSSETTGYVAAFGQATWNASELFHVTAGVRWERESKDAHFSQYANDPTPTLLTLAIDPPIAPTQETADYTHWTWSVSPQLQLTRNVMAYASVSSGFKAGGFNTGYGFLPPSQRGFLPETDRSYELGVKSRALNGRLQINADLFDTIYTNYQDAAFVGAQFTVGNAQKVTDRGAELSIQALLGGGFTLDWENAYADLKYDTYTDGLCYPGRTPDGTQPGSCILSGQHPVDAPPFKSTLSLEYRHFTGFGRWFARADTSYSTRYNTSFSADPRLTQSPYTWVNVRLGLDHGPMEYTLWSNNVGNTHVADFDALLNLFSGDPSTQTFMQMPRSVGITVRWSLE